MGYYIDLVFDPSKEYDCKGIVKKFWDAGARIFPEDEFVPKGLCFVNSKDAESFLKHLPAIKEYYAGQGIDIPDEVIFLDQLEDKMGIHDCETALETFHRDSAYVEMYHPDYPMPYMMDVFKSEPENFKGNWAHIRLSWATEQQEFIEILKNMLELAERIGCRVYDGQLQEYVTCENLDGIAKGFLKAAGNMGNMFGVCKRTKISGLTKPSERLLKILHLKSASE